MSAAARSCVAYSTHRAGVDTLHSLPSRVLKLRKYVAFKPIISGSGCVVNDKESFCTCALRSCVYACCRYPVWASVAVGTAWLGRNKKITTCHRACIGNC